MKIAGVIALCCALVLASCSLAAHNEQESPSPTPPTTVVTKPPEQLVPPPTPDSASSQSELTTRRYNWQFGAKKYRLEIAVPKAIYDYYKRLPRPRTENYSVYVTHPLDDIVVNSLASELKKMSQRADLSELQQVEFAAAFVQDLPYTDDSVTTPYDEYPRYPVETLVDNGGDCEDSSILLVSLLDSMGQKVLLVIFPSTQDKPGHAGVGVFGGQGFSGAYFTYEGANYFYIETTGSGWRVGQVPEELQGVTAHLYPMKPVPILTHTWGEATSSSSSSGILTFQVTVENRGAAIADGIYVLAGFDVGDGTLWNGEESEPFNLATDQRTRVEFSLRVPPGKHTRLVVQVIYNHYAVDQSYSDWFDT